MRDILTDLERWHGQGKRIAVATVVATWGSSPRRPGSRMAVSEDGEITGSVSGGCVENAVVEAAVATLKDNRPQLLHFSVADEEAHQVGLACGGSIDIFVSPLDPEFFTELRACFARTDPFVLMTAVRGPADAAGRELLALPDGMVKGNLGSAWIDSARMHARGLPEDSAPHLHQLGRDLEVFVEVIRPPATLVVVGGTQIAVALTSIARTLAYRTILIDPRSTWANAARFPHLDQLIASWPDAAFQQIEVTNRTAIVALTHDRKLDDPTLCIALQGPAFYVGALGSRRTHEDRRRRLLALGLTEEQVSRLHAPIGLEIGAETPEEIALAIMAEIIAAARLHGEPQPRPEPALASTS